MMKPIREYTLHCMNLSSSCRKAQEQQFFGNAATGFGAMPAQHCWDISCILNCPDTPTAGTCLSVLKHIPLTHIASLDMVVSKGHAPLLSWKCKQRKSMKSSPQTTLRFRSDNNNNNNNNKNIGGVGHCPIKYVYMCIYIHIYIIYVVIYVFVVICLSFFTYTHVGIYTYIYAYRSIRPSVFFCLSSLYPVPLPLSFSQSYAL